MLVVSAATQLSQRITEPSSTSRPDNIEFESMRALAMSVNGVSMELQI
jgi:hypothetical protein